MDNKIQKFEEEIEKAVPEVQELYDILLFDDKLFENTFKIRLDEDRGNKVRELFIIECFSFAFNLSAKEDLIKILKDSDYSTQETELIIKNFSTNFLTAFEELKKGVANKKQNHAEDLGIKETAKDDQPIKTHPSDNSSISHIDVLSEIENPTPSISTTKTSDSKSTGTTPSSTQNSPTDTVTTSSNHPAQPHQIGLGGFGNTSPTPANPAQNIATKLGQNLSTPTTSIPKEVYVSKKPDPYHEPVL